MSETASTTIGPVIECSDDTKCLIGGVLSRAGFKALEEAAPEEVRESINTVERERTIQLQYLRIMAYAIPSAPFIYIYGELINILVIVPIAMVIVNSLCVILMRNVSWFRELNAVLFVLDLVITEAFTWQHGMVTSHSILFLPLIIMGMVIFLPTRLSLALTLLTTAVHLAVIAAQGMRAIPLGNIVQMSRIDPATLDAVLRQRDLLTSSFLFSAALLPGTWFGTYWVFKLLKQRELELARSNALIRRYVPAQLADQIQAGDSSAAETHVRRKLVVFFSDIQGFTATADQLEAEEFSRVLNEYLGEMTRIAEKHGGTIDKFIGDAILIFFGAPKATTDRDHALRCVQMAIDMQKKMAELDRKWFDEGIQVPFKVRMGINAGVATVGSFGSPGRMDYTVIGNQVNLASRLQTHSEPGKILLSHSAWALVKDQIPCVEKGEIQVKGIHYPVKTYEVAA